MASMHPSKIPVSEETKTIVSSSSSRTTTTKDSSTNDQVFDRLFQQQTISSRRHQQQRHSHPLARSPRSKPSQRVNELYEEGVEKIRKRCMNMNQVIEDMSECTFEPKTYWGQKKFAQQITNKKRSPMQQLEPKMLRRPPAEIVIPKTEPSRIPSPLNFKSDWSLEDAENENKENVPADGNSENIPTDGNLTDYGSV